MGKHGRFKRIGEEASRIRKAIELKKTFLGATKEKTLQMFAKLPVTMSKDQMIATAQKEIVKNKKFKSSTPEVQAEYLTIAFDTIDKCPDERISPMRAVELAREIERKLIEHDSSEIKNQN